MDPRVKKHAKIICNYCSEIKKGDMVYIRVQDYPGLELSDEIVKECGRLGARTLVQILTSESERGYFKNSSNKTLEIFPKHLDGLVNGTDVAIKIMSLENTRYGSEINSGKMSRSAKTNKSIFDEIHKKRWCVTLHPTHAFAQEAGMSLEEYSKFCYSAMLRDWKKESENMNMVKEVLDRNDDVRIIGDKTDLYFSIKGRTANASDSKNNMPGGEVFTSPLEDSVEGRIYFDFPFIDSGKEIKGTYLEFDEGEIIDYSASKGYDFLKALIETDEGSRRLGELGIGMNRGIDKFTGNGLFDEKMGGTIHLAIGDSFEECGGTNKSSIHEDFIKTMNPGQLIIGNEVALKDGKFFFE